MKIFLFLTFVVPSCLGEMTLYNLVSTSSINATFPVFSSLKWNSQIHPLTNITLVDLCLNINIFNFCDTTLYNPIDIQPLLRYHNLNPKSPQPFGLFLKNSYASNFVPNCLNVHSNSDKMTWEDLILLTWDQTLALLAQRTGASVLITQENHNTLSKNIRIDPSIINQGKGEVLGTRVEIFGGVILIEGGNYVLDLLQESYSLNTSLHFDVSDDPNYLDGIEASNSTFRLLSYLSMIISLFGIFDTLYILQSLYRNNNNQIPLRNYNTLCLFLSLVSNFCRIFAAIDPLGFLGIFPFLFVRILFTLHQDLSVISNLSALFAWTIMLDNISSSLKLKKASINTGTKRKILLIFIAISFTVCDVILAVIGDLYAYFGDSSVTELPGVFFTLVYFGMIIFVFLVRYWMNNVIINMNKLHPSPSNNQVGIVPGTETIGGGGGKKGSEGGSVGTTIVIESKVKTKLITKGGEDLYNSSIIHDSGKGLVKTSIQKGESGGSGGGEEVRRDKDGKIVNRKEGEEIKARVVSMSLLNHSRTILSKQFSLISSMVSSRIGTFSTSSEANEDKKRKEFAIFSLRVKYKLKRTMSLMIVANFLYCLNISISLSIALGFHWLSCDLMGVIIVGSIISAQLLSIVKNRVVKIIIEK